MAAVDAHAEAARTVLAASDISDVVLATFERDVACNRALIEKSTGPSLQACPPRSTPCCRPRRASPRSRQAVS
jgi:hypothetical protein